MTDGNIIRHWAMLFESDEAMRSEDLPLEAKEDFEGDLASAKRANLEQEWHNRDRVDAAIGKAVGIGTHEADMVLDLMHVAFLMGSNVGSENNPEKLQRVARNWMRREPEMADVIKWFGWWKTIVGGTDLFGDPPRNFEDDVYESGDSAGSGSAPDGI